MYDPLYAGPERTVTDFPFIRSWEDWRIFHVLTHLVVRELPPKVGDKPHFSGYFYPGSPPKLGEEDCGFYVPVAIGEWTIRTSFGLLMLYEQREVRDVPVVRRKGLYPTTSVWWELVEVPRGMAARVSHMVALQGGKLMGEPLGGLYHPIFPTLCATEAADVFVGNIRHHDTSGVYLWRCGTLLRT